MNVELGVEAHALLELAIEAAERAGRVLLEHFERPAKGVETKSSATDPVSDADRASERLILDLIAEHRPEDGVLGEESGGKDSSSGLTWVVDPLDGTVNFLFGIPIWAVSIAVEDIDGFLVGVVHDPNLEETFSAHRGGGAMRNGAPIRVTDQADLSRALIATGFSYDPTARELQADLLRRLLPRVRDIRRGGSAALDLAAVACGRLDGYYEAPVEHWDRAAGTLIVEEAGGVVSDLPAPLDLSTGVVAAGPALHPELVDLVSPSPPG